MRTTTGSPSRITECGLSDGRRLTVRPMQPDDDDRLVAFHDSLSTDTQRLRFFSVHPHLSAREAFRFVHVDGVDRVALVALSGDELVAVARFDRRPGTADAEVAFVVRDDFQRCGLGTLLLSSLAGVARARGITRFVAETLPENQRMLGVMKRFGSDVTARFREGVVFVSIPLVPTATLDPNGSLTS